MAALRAELAAEAARNAAQERELEKRRSELDELQEGEQMTMKWVMLLTAVAALAACDDHDACDPGQRYRAGICYPDMDAAPEAAADAGDEAVAEFGDPCVETSECGGPTDYCAIRPGEPAGYCTRVGCLEEPSICPPDWSCLDLSVFSPELPAMCSAP